MDLSEIVTRTLSDKQLSEALTNCLEKLKGHGSGFPDDVSGLLSALVRGAVNFYTDRPVSKESPTWKKDCTTKTQLYLDFVDVKKRISGEWRHLVAAHDVQESESALDGLCQRAVTTALLVQAGIEPSKFYN